MSSLPIAMLTRRYGQLSAIEPDLGDCARCDERCDACPCENADPGYGDPMDLALEGIPVRGQFRNPIAAGACTR